MHRYINPDKIKQFARYYLTFRSYKLDMIAEVLQGLANYAGLPVLWFLFGLKMLLGDDLRLHVVNCSDDTTAKIRILYAGPETIRTLWRWKATGIKLPTVQTTPIAPIIFEYSGSVYAVMVDVASGEYYFTDPTGRRSQTYIITFNQVQLDPEWLTA